MIQNTGFKSIVKGSSEKDNNKYILKNKNVELLKEQFNLLCTTNTRMKPMFILNKTLFVPGFSEQETNKICLTSHSTAVIIS